MSTPNKGPSHSIKARLEGVLTPGAGPMVVTRDDAQILIELLGAARGVVWKLNHNHATPEYTGPARITREDASIRQIVDAIANVEGR